MKMVRHLRAVRLGPLFSGSACSVNRHLACMQPEVHQRDVDALSRGDLDQPRVFCCAAPPRLERRSARNATTLRRQTDLS